MIFDGGALFLGLYLDQIITVFKNKGALLDEYSIFAP